MHLNVLGNFHIKTDKFIFLESQRNTRGKNTLKNNNDVRFEDICGCQTNVHTFYPTMKKNPERNGRGLPWNCLENEQ